MKKLMFFLAMLLGLVMQSCDLLGINDDEKCGDKAKAYHWRTSHGTGFFTDLNDPNYLDRTYFQGSSTTKSQVIFYKWVDKVCPDEHVKFKASISADVDGDFTVSAKAYWYFFFEEPLTLSASSDGVSRHWEGNGSFGLKQVYGDSGVGEFSMSATIDFPYQGSFEADTTYLFNKLQNVTLEADYRDTKKQ